MPNMLLFPMLSHIAWTGLLYVLLTAARAPSVWKIGAREDGINPWARLEPRISANLSNQFEWPIFFYVACAILVSNEELYNPAYLSLAWMFIAGRVLHSLIQILTSNIRLRGLVFTINFVAVLSMWGLLLKDQIHS